MFLYMRPEPSHAMLEIFDFGGTKRIMRMNALFGAAYCRKMQAARVR